MTLEEKKVRYQELCHAMQTGVAVTIMQLMDEKETEPKHLRVGINRCSSDQGALASLLIKKGIFTEEEYMDSLIEFMEREVKSYEDSINEHYHTDHIKLA